jgi:hypothetical protein
LGVIGDGRSAIYLEHNMVIVMDERARKIIDAARETVRRIDSARETWAAENAARDLYQPLVRERPQPLRSKPMTTQQQDWSAWDAWAKGHVDAGMAVLAQVIGERVGEIHRAINKELDEVRAELTALKVELRVLRGEVKGEVATLPNWRRKTMRLNPEDREAAKHAEKICEIARLALRLAGDNLADTAISLVCTARAMANSDPTARTAVALIMIDMARELDEHVVDVRWQ